MGARKRIKTIFLIKNCNKNSAIERNAIGMYCLKKVLKNNFFEQQSLRNTDHFLFKKEELIVLYIMHQLNGVTGPQHSRPLEGPHRARRKYVRTGRPFEIHNQAG